MLSSFSKTVINKLRNNHHIRSTIANNSDDRALNNSNMRHCF